MSGDGRTICRFYKYKPDTNLVMWQTCTCTQHHKLVEFLDFPLKICISN